MGAVGTTTAGAAEQTAQDHGGSTRATLLSLKKAGAQPRLTLAYVGCLTFVLLYCSRPYEWIPGMMLFPAAKIAAAIALAGFLPALLMSPTEYFSGLKRMKFLVLLFLQLSIAAPFAVWPGGSFEVVFEEMSKVVLISLCASLAVNTVPRLRRVLLVQTLPIVVMVLVSVAGFGKVIVDSAGQTRMRGLVGGIFENPNDYAFAVALVFPIAVYMMLKGRSPVSKAFWGVTALSMVYVVFQTLSRGGLLALAVAAGLTMWERGMKEKRYGLVVAAVLGLVLMMGAAPDKFLSRVQSIVDFTKDETGSGWARRALLERAINVALTHPVFGVGPGNFQTFTADWHGAHNTYAQFGAEAGLPATLFFILLLGGAIRTAHQIAKKAAEPDLKGLANTLKVSLLCYAVGAFFADTAYHFFPYLFVGYVYGLRFSLDQGKEKQTPGKVLKATASGAQSGNGLRHGALKPAAAARKSGLRTPSFLRKAGP